MKLNLLLLTALLCAKLNAQTETLQVLGQWDDNTLVHSSNNLQYNDVWGYVAPDGTEYALLGSRQFVHVLQLQADGTPVENSRFAGTQTVHWRDMKTFGSYAYGVCDSCSEGLMILDLSSLPAPATFVQRTTSFWNKAHNIYIDEQAGRMYAVGTNTQGSGIVVLDLNADPANPTLLAQMNLDGGYIHDLHVVGNIAYASHGYSGLYVYDLTDLSNPITLGSLTTYTQQGYNHSSWLDPARGLLVFADENFDRSVKIADVSDPMDITVTDLFRSALLGTQTNSIAHNPFIRGRYAIVSYYHDGIQIFDIADETDVVQVAGFDTDPTNTTYSGTAGAWGTYPFLPSQRILGSDVKNGLFVLQSNTLNLDASPNAALPIELRNFTAAPRNRDHYLEWTTVYEHNSDHFLVEHSTDGIEFTALERIPAAGFSNVDLRYEHLHKDVADGVHYYRLREVDRDGSFSFSDIIRLEKKNDTTLEVHPNPTTGPIDLVLPARSEDFLLELTDPTGKSYPLPYLENDRLDLSFLPTGTYFLSITDGRISETIRLVKW